MQETFFPEIPEWLTALSIRLFLESFFLNAPYAYWQLNILICMNKQDKAIGYHPFVRKSIESCGKYLSLWTSLACHLLGPSNTLTDFWNKKNRIKMLTSSCYNFQLAVLLGVCHVCLSQKRGYWIIKTFAKVAECLLSLSLLLWIQNSLKLLDSSFIVTVHSASMKMLPDLLKNNDSNSDLHFLD